MQVTNCGPGVHVREIAGVEKLKGLPPSWYGFTNLEIATGPGRAREIDVVLIAPDRIFVIDLKDWHGRIESDGEGGWLQNGKDRGRSPVAKINQNARDIGLLLAADVKKRFPGVQPPQVQGLILITGQADFSQIAAIEENAVCHIDYFLRHAVEIRTRISSFGTVSPVDVLDKAWKDRLSKFFNAKSGPIRPGKRRYASFIAQSGHSTFEHPAKIYSEYDAVDESSPLEMGTIRLWDFTKADPRFQNEDSRREIAGRERQALAHLRDANGAIESAVLVARVN